LVGRRREAGVRPVEHPAVEAGGRALVRDPLVAESRAHVTAAQPGDAYAAVACVRLSRTGPDALRSGAIALVRHRHGRAGSGCLLRRQGTRADLAGASDRYYGGDTKPLAVHDRPARSFLPRGRVDPAAGATDARLPSTPKTSSCPTGDWRCVTRWPALIRLRSLRYLRSKYSPLLSPAWRSRGC
jgi:hypothetical protein